MNIRKGRFFGRLHSRLVNPRAADKPNDRSFDDFASGQHHQELLVGNYI
jgi:hypothetical protein